MRKLDYLRLARLSLGSRKKTTIQTVLGISFGLILLFPLLFIVIGFYGAFNGQLNADSTYRTQCITYSPVKTPSGKVFCSEEFEKKNDKIYGVKNNLKYDYCYMSNGPDSEVYFAINGGEKFKAAKASNYYSENRFLGIQIIDKDCASNPFLDADYAAFNAPLLAGKTFSKKNSKGEIMVSSRFIDDYGYKPKEIIGATISIWNDITRTRQEFSSSEDELVQPDEYRKGVYVPYLLNYKIVGVYNSEIYYRHSPRTSSLAFNLSSPQTKYNENKDYFWITTASLGEDGNAIAPTRVIKENRVEVVTEEITEVIITYDSWYYYADTPAVLAEQVTGEGFAFIPLGLGAFNKAAHYAIYSKTQLLEFHNFQYARKGYDKIIENYRNSVTGDPNDYIYLYERDIVPSRFDVYQRFFDRFIYVCIALALFGGIIFIATLLNLINTTHHSVESSKGFLGICRAEGMKRRGIRRIYLSQINLIFAISYIATIIFGGAACIAIKIVFDKQMKNVLFKETKMFLTIDWWYIPISFVILLVLTTIISFLISQILVRKVNKTPVIEILSEENRM